MARELPSSARRLQARERQTRALELRLAGASTAAIAGVLGVNRTTAWRLLDRALGELVEEVKERAEQLRAVQAARIETDLADLWPRARAGDMAAYRVIVRLYERQGRLLGLDLERPPDDAAPARIEIMFGVPPSPGERPVVVDGEYEEVAQIEPGGEDGAEESGEPSGPETAS